MINSYPSIYNLGHSAVADLLKHPVIVEEKVDGSQISFRKTFEGEIQIRSKGAPINVVAPEGMFKLAVESILARKDKLVMGYTYRGEYLAKPKHNCLCYDHVPKDHIIIFDVNGDGTENYHSPKGKRVLAHEIGYDCVPVLYEGLVSDIEQFRKLLDTESVLGGQKIEGVVIKPANYDLFGRDKKVLMAKFVSEAFREVHSKTWDKEHKTPGHSDIIQLLAANYGTQARWQKALIHLRERNQIQDAPQDIGFLMKEVPEDVEKECTEAIKEDLLKWAWPQLRRMLCRGLPEWYKDQLLKKQFDQ